MTAPNTRTRRHKRQRARARQEARQSPVEHVNDNIGPTPQTRARLKPEPLDRLKRSTLTTTQHEAAVKIRRAFELRHGPFVKLANMERTDNPGDHSMETDKNVSLQLLFNHWYVAMLQRNWGVRHILAVLIDGLSLTESARVYSMDRRKQRRFFIKGLQLFVLIQAGRIKIVDKNAPATV